MEKDISIRLLSEWHVSSGLGDSFRSDAVLLRDNDGFPYIPGKSVKGLLREGARTLGLCSEYLRKAEFFFWGTRHDAVDSNVTGKITVSSAYFPRDIKAQVVGLPNARAIIDDLTVLRSQTALNDDGVAKAASLRTMELGIAGTELEAHITVPQLDQYIDDQWLEQYFACVCAAVKALGNKRSRGLGACCIRLKDYTGQITLPRRQEYLANLNI